MAKEFNSAELSAATFITIGSLLRSVDGPTARRLKQELRGVIKDLQTNPEGVQAPQVSNENLVEILSTLLKRLDRSS